MFLTDQARGRWLCVILLLEAIILATVLWWAVKAFGQTLPGVGGCPGIQFSLTPNGYDQQDVGTTAVSLRGPLATVAVAVLVTETAGWRYRDDGGTPTASAGMVVSSTGAVVVCPGSVNNFKMIRSGGTNATVNVQYYGR